MNRCNSRVLFLSCLPVLIFLVILALPNNVSACTNFLITKGASADGSTMITYAADAHDMYGELVYLPAGTHLAGATRQVYDWDTAKHLGQIPEAPYTYAVVGHMAV